MQSDTHLPPRKREGIIIKKNCLLHPTFFFYRTPISNYTVKWNALREKRSAERSFHIIIINIINVGSLEQHALGMSTDLPPCFATIISLLTHYLLVSHSLLQKWLQSPVPRWAVFCRPRSPFSRGLLLVFTLSLSCSFAGRSRGPLKCTCIPIHRGNVPSSYPNFIWPSFN